VPLLPPPLPKKVWASRVSSDRDSSYLNSISGNIYLRDREDQQKAFRNSTKQNGTKMGSQLCAPFQPNRGGGE
jgi:hypothetical protein